MKARNIFPFFFPFCDKGKHAYNRRRLRHDRSVVLRRNSVNFTHFLSCNVMNHGSAKNESCVRKNYYKLQFVHSCYVVEKAVFDDETYDLLNLLHGAYYYIDTNDHGHVTCKFDGVSSQFK